MTRFKPGEILAIYNHHAGTPVKKFENATIGMRRLQALLAKIEVSMDSAIAATWPVADAPLPDDPDWTPADVGYGDKIEDDERLTAIADAETDAVFAEVPFKESAKRRPAKAAKTPPKPAKANRANLKARRAAAEAAAPAPVAPTVAGKARGLIVAACSRPEGATAAELFATTGWKFASWSHQMKLAAKATGWTQEIKKVDGVTRYFLTESR